MMLNIGSLDSFSAFKFENKFYQFKQMLKNSRLPFQQLYNRISEEHNLVDQNEPEKSPKIFYKKGKIIKIELPGITLSLQFNENCCQLKDGKIVLIQRFATINDNIICFAKYYSHVENLFSSPCDSELVGIFKVDSNNLKETVKFNVNEIVAKCLRIKSSYNFVIIKMMH